MRAACSLRQARLSNAAESAEVQLLRQEMISDDLLVHTIAPECRRPSTHLVAVGGRTEGDVRRHPMALPPTRRRGGRLLEEIGILSPQEERNI